jgi:mannan endo-1,4-beta-mannosidase
MVYLLNGFDLFGQGFTVEGTKLIDADGKEFTIKGVNVPSIWYLGKSAEALKKIAGLNANCVRIVWSTVGKADELDKVFQQCVKLEIIPMVELHDATGSPKVEKLLETVSYYTTKEVKEVLLKYEKYLLINLANEWGDYYITPEYWKDSYGKAVEMLRNAGINSTLVIDGPKWGQDLQPILQYGKALLDMDPQKNILFSVHMYGFWNDSQKIETELQKAHDLLLPLIIGEFGYDLNKGNNNLNCKVDHKLILRKCNELGYGYLPWSWAGNDENNAWLDMSDWDKLTWWGKELFEGPNGITATAKKSSVFEKK